MMYYVKMLFIKFKIRLKTKKRKGIYLCCGSCKKFKMDDFSWGTCGDDFIVHVTDKPCGDYVMCDKNKLSDAYRLEYEDEC